MIAHNGSGFDSYIVLKKLPQWRSNVNSIKKGVGIVSIKIFNGYSDEKKNISQYVHFRCGKVHFKKELRKIGLIYLY